MVVYNTPTAGFAHLGNDGFFGSRLRRAAEAHDCAIPPSGSPFGDRATAVVCPSGNFGATVMAWHEERTRGNERSPASYMLVGHRQPVEPLTGSGAGAAPSRPPVVSVALPCVGSVDSPGYEGWTLDSALERFLQSPLLSSLAHHPDNRLRRGDGHDRSSSPVLLPPPPPSAALAAVEATLRERHGLACVSGWAQVCHESPRALSSWGHGFQDYLPGHALQHHPCGFVPSRRTTEEEGGGGGKGLPQQGGAPQAEEAPCVRHVLSWKGVEEGSGELRMDHEITLSTCDGTLVADVMPF